MPEPPEPADRFAALTAALKALAPNPSTLLVAPTFDRNSTEQYDDFQLFIKSVKSWFTLQNIVKEEKTNPDDTTSPDSIRLEYVLNFLGNTCRKKYEWWKPTGTASEIEKAKASADKFMGYLLSTMDHEVSQCCRIYQLEDVRIWAWESPDELIECLHALADNCNFPTDEEKECNEQYRLIWALSNKDLVKKLLALDLKATTAKMLEVCQTRIAISDNLDAMGLAHPKPVHAIHQGNHKKQCQQGSKPTANQHQCSSCVKSHSLGCASCSAKDATCNKCGKVGHWKPSCHGGSPKKPQKKPPKKGKGRGQKIDNIGMDDYHLDEVDIAILQYHQSEWLTKHTGDPECKKISDIHIDAMTEAFATVQMPAEIGLSWQATLRCKVDTSTGGNVMPLHAFSKLFPRQVTTDGTPTGLRPTRTCLTAYNGSTIKQYGTLGIAIDWKPEGKNITNRLHTQWYIANTPGPTILGLTPCSKLRIVELKLCSWLSSSEANPTDILNRMPTSTKGPH